MLLTISRAVRRTKQPDDGAAMLAVISLMALGLVITALIMSSLVSAIGFSTVTRAGVQSLASAEAGIAAARAGLLAGTCSAVNAVYTSAPGDPGMSYRAEIYTEVGSGWSSTPTCPATPAIDVRIVSTGSAEAVGVGGGAGDDTRLEAVLAAAEGEVTLAASGPAIYSYGNGSLGNGASLVSSDGSSPDIQVKRGNYICNGGVSGSADLVVEGTVTVEAGCKISGDLYATGAVNFSGAGSVSGNLIAPSVQFYNGTIGGRLWTPGLFDMSQGNATIQGQFKAGSFRFVGGTTNGRGYVYGQTNLSGVWGSLNQTITTQTVTGAADWWWNANKNKFVLSNPLVNPSFSSDLPATPVIPDWVDFGAQPSHYTTESWEGFTIRTMTGACGNDQILAAVSAFASRPGVIDARNCSSGVVVTGDANVVLGNDLVIIARSITVASGGRFSSTANARLWLINPDTTANRLPDCAGQSMSISGNDNKFTGVRTMIYTPCSSGITASIQIHGQIFSGSTALVGGTKLTYTAIGLPGINLDTGAVSGSTPSEADRILLSLRNIEG